MGVKGEEEEIYVNLSYNIYRILSSYRHLIGFNTKKVTTINFSKLLHLYQKICQLKLKRILAKSLLAVFL